MMHNLRRLQTDLLDYLVDQSSGIENYIAEGGLINKQTRLHIYGNAYRLRLRDVIDTDHELLSFYLGDDLFDQLVAGYIDTHPSTYPSLRDFCCEIPAYLKTTPPFSDHPILGELARFERTLLFAFDANDATVADMSELSGVPLDKWPNIQVRFHPSVQLFETNTNCVETWRALKQKTTPPEAIRIEDVAWIVWRTFERITEFRSLAVSEIVMIKTFLQGGTLAGVCEELLDYHKEDEVSEIAVKYISQWIQRGQVSKIRY